MTSIHLMIEDDFVETFMESLPKDKIIVVEEDFKQNKEKLHNVMKNYKDGKTVFTPYYESMKDLNIWLKEKGAE